MTVSFDASEQLLEQVNQALASKTPLRIQGSGSKAFLGRAVEGQLLDVRAHRGIVSYDPTELVITARAGTPLAELEAAQQPVPISAASHDGRFLNLRLEGGEGSVNAARERIGGDDLQASYWSELREQRLAFFADPRPLWRLSLPNNTPALNLPGEQLVDWAGAQRWLKTDADAVTVRGIAVEVGGHASCFTAGAAANPFQPLSAPLLRYHRQLKAALDPQGIFNPGRMYSEV